MAKTNHAVWSKRHYQRLPFTKLGVKLNYWQIALLRPTLKPPNVTKICSHLGSKIRHLIDCSDQSLNNVVQLTMPNGSVYMKPYEGFLMFLVRLANIADWHLHNPESTEYIRFKDHFFLIIFFFMGEKKNIIFIEEI